jgi:hypothetical protein
LSTPGRGFAPPSRAASRWEAATPHLARAVEVYFFFAFFFAAAFFFIEGFTSSRVGLDRGPGGTATLYFFFFLAAFFFAAMDELTSFPSPGTAPGQ